MNITKFAVAILLALGFCSSAAIAADPSAAAPLAAEAKPITVFGAASLTNALEEVSKAFTAGGGAPVKLSFAASSALARQIEAGAQADVFVSADLEWMDYLEQRKLIQAASRQNLLGNRLVLISPASSGVSVKLTQGVNLLAALGDGRLATGEVETVPVGRYAKAALTHLGVWDSVGPRIAGAENVRAALAFVARGEAPLGIVYATDARAEPRVRVVDVFAENSHPPIVYPIALTASASPAAQAYLRYLTGAEARKVFERFGFTLR